MSACSAATTAAPPGLPAINSAGGRHRRRPRKRRASALPAAGVVDYDWLILAVGIRDDYRPWFGNDRHRLPKLRRRFGSAWQAADIASLKAIVSPHSPAAIC